MKILVAFLCFFITCHLGTSNVCLLEPETGPCKAYFQRFYYDAATKTCKQFIYGGCRGNGNNFGNEESCLSACAGNKRDADDDSCSQEPDTGLCRGYFPKYYYDSVTKSCKEFIYGGCGGNSNNYDTEEECLASCNGQKKRSVDVSVCNLEAMTGNCRAYIPRYAYDSVTGSCKRFIYGGCGGNANNFKSEGECISICGGVKKRAVDKKREAEDFCMFEPKTGLCFAYFRRYYYDHVDNSCKKFVYGGCGGNENNFKDEKDCMNACGH